MNDDYLWDKTGPPDPQIQQLEEILGALSYQPKPLVIPKDVAAPGRRRYFPLLAIAASVLLAIVAAGVWFRVRSRSEAPQRQVQVQPQEQPVQPAPVTIPSREPNPRQIIVATNNRHRKTSAASALREREEALMAKEQVMLALRLASEKLSLLHRRTQSPTPANQIKNQHRTG